MARAVVVLCDVHLENGKRVRAEELPPIDIEGKGPRVLALCSQHKKEYYDPFVELVDDLARALSDGDAPVLDAGQGGTDQAEADDDADQGETGSPDRPSREDPERAVEESPAMTAVPDQPDTARWDCPVDGCDKSYSASGENRAEDLKRLGNLHLSTAHDMDKAARVELLSA